MKARLSTKLFDYVAIREDVIDELVREGLGADSKPEKLAMLLVAVRDTIKNGGITEAFWTLNRILDALYLNSKEHFSASLSYLNKIEKQFDKLLEEKDAEEEKGGRGR